MTTVYDEDDDEQTRPAKPKKSPAPLFHAFTRRIRRELYEAYHLFLAAFRDAADRLRAGDRNASFPWEAFRLACPSSGPWLLSEPQDKKLRACLSKFIRRLTAHPPAEPRLPPLKKSSRAGLRSLEHGLLSCGMC